MATTATLLASLETAIEARLAGRPVDAYTIHGVNVQYTDLAQLYDLRDRLRRELAGQNRNRFNLADLRS